MHLWFIRTAVNIFEYSLSIYSLLFPKFGDANFPPGFLFKMPLESACRGIHL